MNEETPATKEEQIERRVRDFSVLEEQRQLLARQQQDVNKLDDAEDDAWDKMMEETEENMKKATTVRQLISNGMFVSARRGGGG